MSERPRVFVVTSGQSAARDAAAIAGGIPSRALMQRAGAAVAAEIALRFRPRLTSGVVVFTGPGNNGGDGWVVARALASSGVAVRVVETVPAQSPDAVAERELALSSVAVVPWRDDVTAAPEPIVVDALLGTGSSGAPRGAIASAVATINASRAYGASIVAVDLPTGVDATTGSANHAVVAGTTITFGAVKRGHLIARQACGDIVTVDIGLGDYADAGDGAPAIVDAGWVEARVPPIPADAHKGTRKKLIVIGGAPGMAGAAILAARAAIRSGVGMVRLLVTPESLPAVQSAEPSALGGLWPDSDAATDRDICSWADGLVIGPGLGHTPEARALVDRVLARWRGPVVLDADALNVFDGRLDDLRRALGGRPALLTPHPAEFARLVGATIEDVLADRFTIGAELARRSGAAVLLKGLPTVVTSPNGDARVSAAGTPVLATAGSGDVLSGIAGTLLAQIGDAPAAGAAAAWIHGRAAELAWRAHGQRHDLPDRGAIPAALRAAMHGPVRGGQVRGLTLEDVLAALVLAWPRAAGNVTRYPVLLELPGVGERA